MSKEEEYVGRGGGIGYYASTDVYKDNEKVRSEAYRVDWNGRSYADVYDNDGKKVDSYYTDDND